MLFNSIAGLFSNDIGIDLGTANTLVYVKDKGVVLCEPSVMAIHKPTNTIVAIGKEAKRMLGKTPADIVAIRPLKDGVIADFEVTERMIRYFISKVHNRGSLVRPRVVIGVPSGITEVERRAVIEAAEQAGARKVYLIDEPMAAAIGANLQIHEPDGNMILDIGGGTTEVAVISLGGMVVSKTIRVAGDEMDEAIVQYIKKVHNLLIGERSAEEIKIKVGTAYVNDDQEYETIEIKGRDTISGLPKTLKVSAKEISKALKSPINMIVQVVKDTLEITPPALISDIVDRGIVIVGGGALLKDLDKLLSYETQLPVILADDPFRCVVIGTGKYLNELKNIERARRRKIIHWEDFYIREEKNTK